MSTSTTDEIPPFYEFHAFVCTNHRPDGHPKGSCGARGSERLRNYMKVRAKELGLKRARINNAGCLDRCEHGPCVVVYPDGAWYHIETEADVDRILAEHGLKGLQVDELLIGA